MEVSVPGGGNIYLGIGNWLPISYLEQQDTKDLADLYLCAARRDWSHDGNVSLRAYYDHSQRGGVRAWPNLCERRNEQVGHEKRGAALLQLTSARVRLQLSRSANRRVVDPSAGADAARHSLEIRGRALRRLTVGRQDPSRLSMHK